MSQTTKRKADDGSAETSSIPASTRSPGESQLPIEKQTALNKQELEWTQDQKLSKGSDHQHNPKRQKSTIFPSFSTLSGPSGTPKTTATSSSTTGNPQTPVLSALKSLTDCPVDGCVYSSAHTKDPANSMHSHLYNLDKKGNKAHSDAFSNFSIKKFRAALIGVGGLNPPTPSSSSSSLVPKKPPASKPSAGEKSRITQSAVPFLSKADLEALVVRRNSSRTARSTKSYDLGLSGLELEASLPMASPDTASGFFKGSTHQALYPIKGEPFRLAMGEGREAFEAGNKEGAKIVPGGFFPEEEIFWREGTEMKKRTGLMGMGAGTEASGAGVGVGPVEIVEDEEYDDMQDAEGSDDDEFTIREHYETDKGKEKYGDIVS